VLNNGGGSYLARRVFSSPRRWGL